MLTSCGGSDPAPAGDGGGGGGSTGLTIPVNAVTLTKDNAEFVALSALGSIGNIDSVLEFDDSVPAKNAESPKTMLSIQGALNLVVDKVNDRNRSSFPVATGVEPETIIFCNGMDASNGLITEIETETETDTGFSFSGTVDFMDCQLFPGFMVDGIISFDGTETLIGENKGDFHVTVSSSGLTFTFDTMIVALAGEEIFLDPIDPIIITLQFNYEETANDISGEFSKLYDYSVTIIPEGGFLVTTTEPFEGNFNNNPAITRSGQIIIEGTNNTRLLVTLIDDTKATVEWDDGNGSRTFEPVGTISLMGAGDA